MKCLGHDCRSCGDDLDGAGAVVGAVVQAIDVRACEDAVQIERLPGAVLKLQEGDIPLEDEVVLGHELDGLVVRIVGALVRLEEFVLARALDDLGENCHDTFSFQVLTTPR